jgi:hypothetical protein
MANADHLAALLVDYGWMPLRGAEGFRSGILLLQSVDKSVRDAQPDQVRRRFHEAGIVLSAYPRGLVRISLPSVAINAEMAQRISSVFGAVAKHYRQDRGRLWPSSQKVQAPQPVLE